MTERRMSDTDKSGQNEKVVDVAPAEVVETSTAQITCGLIMPIATNEIGTAEHWSQVRTIIEDALKSTDFNVKMVSESDAVQVIHHNIVTNIYTNDIVICDVSSRNPNVMFELGMRLTFDKPVVIIKDRETPFSFDVGNIQHLEYPRSLNYVEVQDFQQSLRDKTLSTLAASKRDNYSPFLSHYKIKHVSKIGAEYVERDDYIVSALRNMSELLEYQNTKINSLNKNTSRPLNDPGKNSEGMISTAYDLKLKLVADEIYNSVIITLPTDMDSAEINRLCREYIKDTYNNLTQTEITEVMRILSVRRAFRSPRVRL